MSKGKLCKSSILRYLVYKKITMNYESTKFMYLTLNYLKAKKRQQILLLLLLSKYSSIKLLV